MEQFDIGKNGSQAMAMAQNASCFTVSLPCFILESPSEEAGAAAVFFICMRANKTAAANSAARMITNRTFLRVVGDISSLSPVIGNSSVQHKKILLRVREEGQHRIHTDKLSV